MYTKEYRLEIENHVLVFYNIKTGSEGGRFDTKLEAFSQIIEMVKDESITPKHALCLFDKILELEFPLEKMRGLHSHKILKKQIMTSISMEKLYRSLEELVLISQTKEAHLKLCGNCKDHGTIYTPNGKTSSIHSKVEGFQFTEYLYQNKIINLIEKEKLIKEIKESKIPMYDEENISRQN